jgi:hypothetical protein
VRTPPQGSRSCTAECYIYIIAIQGVDVRKIGISEAPSARLAQLSTASPFDMKIERLYSFPSRREACAVESIFHQRYSEYRARGEWFQLSYGSAQDCLNIEVAEYLMQQNQIEDLPSFIKAMSARGISECESGQYWTEPEDSQ